MRKLFILFLIASLQSCILHRQECKKESLGDIFSMLNTWDSSTIRGLALYSRNNEMQSEKIEAYINSFDTSNIKRIEMYHRKSFLLKIESDSTELCHSTKDTLVIIEHSSSGERLFRQKYLILMVNSKATVWEYGYANNGSWILKGIYSIPDKYLSFMFELIKKKEENHKEEVDFNSSIFITTYINGEIQVFPFLYSPAKIYSTFVKAMQMK